MRVSSIFVPVIFLLFLFAFILPRLLRHQSTSAQVLPPTSVTPAAAVAGERIPAGLLAVQPLPDTRLPELQALAAPYLTGKAVDAVVVAVDGRFALPVVQQPKDQPAFVSSEAGVLTQFRLPNQYGTTGLLAHNFLSGRLFGEMRRGDIVSVVYGDGNAAQFRVEKIESYQALSPTSPYSQFIDLSSLEGRPMSSASLFNRVYTYPGRVVFQTCIAANNESSWGRLFITATRITQLPAPSSQYNN